MQCINGLQVASQFVCSFFSRIIICSKNSRRNYLEMENMAPCSNQPFFLLLWWGLQWDTRKKVEKNVWNPKLCKMKQFYSLLRTCSGTFIATFIWTKYNVTKNWFFFSIIDSSTVIAMARESLAWELECANKSFTHK